MARKLQKSSKKKRSNGTDTIMNKRSSTRLGVFGQRYMLIAAVFILAFAGLGGYMIHTSKASSGCTYNYYRYGSYGHCVSDIQLMLYNIGSHSRLASTPFGYSGFNKYGIYPTDNSFGWSTYNQVYSFQAAAYISKDGIVGPQTWNQLCEWNNYSGHYWVVNDAGCARWNY